MSYSAESVRYLHMAYTIFIAVQVAYVAWLATRWYRTSPSRQPVRKSNA